MNHTRGITIGALALLALARDTRAQAESAGASETSPRRVVLTPGLASRWLVGARAMQAAIVEWESSRAQRADRLLVELRAPKNQAYFGCRDSLAATPRYRDLVARLPTDEAVIPTQERLLAMAQATCGPLPSGLFDPDTATSPDPTPDFLLVAVRASGLDRTTFILFADRIIKWGILEAHK